MACSNRAERPLHPANDCSVKGAYRISRCDGEKDKGYKLAIVSNKIDFAVKDLRDEFFDGLIEVAVGDSDDTENKPAPDMVFKALDELKEKIAGIVEKQIKEHSYKNFFIFFITSKTD